MIAIAVNTAYRGLALAWDRVLDRWIGITHVNFVDLRTQPPRMQLALVHIVGDVGYVSVGFPSMLEGGEIKVFVSSKK